MGGAKYHLENLLEFLGGQLLVAGPFAWCAGIWALIVLWKKEWSREHIFLVAFSLPIFLFFGYSSLKKAGEANWTVLAYLTLAIAAARYFIDGSKVKRAIFNTALGFSLVLSLLAMAHTRFGVIPLARINPNLAVTDATNWFYGWKEVASEVNKFSPDYVITQSHTLSAELNCYLGGKVYPWIDEQHTRYSQLNLWGFPDNLKNTRGVYVFADNPDLPDFGARFKNYATSPTVTVYRNGFPIRTYHIVPLEKEQLTDK
jgi:hypothetical protein